MCKTTNCNIENIFIVLPRRLAFKQIYYVGQLGILSIGLAIVRNLILGVPYNFCMLVYLSLKHRSVIWGIEYLSKYEDLKILVVDGGFIRNMKKKNVEAAMEVFNIADTSISKVLSPSPRGPHASAYSHISNIGVLFTSKKQDDKLEVLSDTDSYGYAQYFGQNNYTTKINNPNLVNLLNDKGVVKVVTANLMIKNTSEKFMKYNINGKQYFMEISENLRKDSKLFVEKCGGEDRVSDAINLIKYYEDTIKESDLCIKKMCDTSRESRYKTFSDHKERTYSALVVLSKKDLGEFRNVQIERRIKMIDKLIGPDDL